MPNDTESPDHAGLRADARALADEFYSDGVRPKEMAELITQFGINAWVSGRNSQQAELATQQAELSSANAFGDKCTESIEEMGVEVTTLRGDRAQLNADVNKLASLLREQIGPWIPADEVDGPGLYGTCFTEGLGSDVYSVGDVSYHGIDNELCLVDGTRLHALRGVMFCKINLPPVEAK